MSCEDFDRLIAPYLENSLNAAQVREMHFHLVDCEDCSAYLSSYRIVVSLLREQRRLV